MSRIALDGNAGGTGTFTIASPNSNSNFTLTLPQANTTVVGTDATQTLTNKTLTSPTITGAVVSSMASSVITAATAQNSTSGTSIDFTGIPSWVRRITVMFNGVSTNGTSPIQIQLGDAGGVETSGYLGVVNNSTGVTTTNFTSGFLLVTGTAAAAITQGQIIISLIGSNTWSEMSLFGRSDSNSIFQGCGTKALSETLDRVRITTVNGTDAFDAGSINILYE